jgi:hypothetical protein
MNREPLVLGRLKAPCVGETQEATRKEMALQAAPYDRAIPLWVASWIYCRCFQVLFPSKDKIDIKIALFYVSFYSKHVHDLLHICSCIVKGYITVIEENWHGFLARIRIPSKRAVLPHVKILLSRIRCLI